MKEEIEKILTRFNSDMCQSQGSDTPVSDQQRDKEKATEAIMKLVASKVPKEKEWFVEQPDTHRNYVGGYNFCRQKILDNLGVEE